MEACNCWRLHQATKAPSFRTFTYIVTGTLLLWINNVNCIPTTFATPTELAQRLSSLKIPTAAESPTVTPTTTYVNPEDSSHVETGEFFSHKKSPDIVSCYLGDGLMLTSGFTEPRFCPYVMARQL